MSVPIAPTHSSNSSRVTEPGGELQPEAPVSPALKSPRREDAPVMPGSGASSNLSKVNWDELSRQIKEARNNQLVCLHIDLPRLAALCRNLSQLGDELSGTEAGSLRPLAIVLHDAGCRPDFDYACLLDLANRSSGLYMDTLKLDISVRDGWPRKLNRVIVEGAALKSLQLNFCDLNLKRSGNVRQSFLRCMQSRKFPLELLELEGFSLCMPHSGLKEIVRKGGLISLSLVSNASSPQLAADFRVADLLAGSLRELRLFRLMLSPHHMEGVGKQLGMARELESLHIEECCFKGKSEEIFCGMINNASLRSLNFFNNRVEERNIGPERLLRVLSYLPKLELLQVDAFADQHFGAELERLRAQHPQLEIQQMPTYVGTAPGLRVRSGWHPELDAQALDSQALAMPPTPPFSDSSTEDL